MSGRSPSAAKERCRFRVPRRQWVVESRPAMYPHLPWERNLGPYFFERTAKDMLRRVRWFSTDLVEWRVRRGR